MLTVSRPGATQKLGVIPAKAGTHPATRAGSDPYPASLTISATASTASFLGYPLTPECQAFIENYARS